MCALERGRGGVANKLTALFEIVNKAVRISNLVP